MRYTPIPPINYIEKVVERTKSIFMLAQLWTIEEYRKAISNSKLDLIVLDNGAYEGELVSDRRLVEVIEEVADLKPETRIYAIVPDVMQDPKATTNRIRQFFKFLDKNNIKLPKNVSLLGVIQVNPNIDIKSALRQTITFSYKLQNIAMEYGYNLRGFAIPIWFYRKWGCRDQFASALRLVYNSHMYIHALGLDDINELRYLRFGFDSVDSSMPFTLAYYGLKLNDIPVLDKETKTRLGIDRVPLKQKVPENKLYLENLEALLRCLV